MLKFISVTVKNKILLDVLQKRHKTKTIKKTDLDTFMNVEMKEKRPPNSKLALAAGFTQIWKFAFLL